MGFITDTLFPNIKKLKKQDKLILLVVVPSETGDAEKEPEIK